MRESATSLDHLEPHEKPSFPRRRESNFIANLSKLGETHAFPVREDDGFFDYCVTGFGLAGSRPYLATASATTDCAITPSSASAFSAATVT
jgi:hypothetical protein